MECKEYLEGLHKKEFSPIENSMIQYAAENHVPIIKPEGLRFLLQITRMKQPKSILEIGCAIGFSAIEMHSICNSKIVTLEKNPEMIELASLNFKKANCQEDITIIPGDALDYNPDITFDMIFIDAAKSKYVQYFEKYEKFLNPGGVIVADNLIFHELILEDDKEKLTKNQRNLVRKIDEYNRYIMERKDYDSSIYDIGDGMSLSIKK